MKKIVFNILVIGLISLYGVFFLAGCDQSPSLTEAEKAIALLKSATWKINTVTVDGALGISFKNMTLSFTSSTYSTANGSVVWPASGSWTFSDATGKVIKRDDGVDVTVEAISETALILSLTWSKTTLGKGRNQSITGKHVFIFSK